MRRTASLVVTAAALLCAASCLDIKDVVQPAEVEAGEKFEAAIELRCSGQVEGVEGLSYAGVVAVSIPAGAEVLKGTYEGAAKGKLERREAVGTGDLPERPGYVWVYFVTAKTYQPAECAGNDYVVKLTVRAPEAPGGYGLGYATGAVTAAGSDINYDCVYWGKAWEAEGQDPIVERGITVK